LYSIHPHKDEVYDILQDANITLINKQKDFDEKKEFLPWAFSIVRWTWMAHKKKRAREIEKITCDSSLMDIVLDFPQDEGLRNELLKEIKIEQYRLLKLIRNRLSVKQNNLLDCLLDGKGIKEISEEWGAKYGTIQTLKHRLLKKMREVLLQIKLNQKYDYSS